VNLLVRLNLGDRNACPIADRLSVSKSLIELNGQSGEAGARGTASGWQSSQQLTHLLGGMALGAVKASCDSCFGPLGFGQARSPSGVARGLERVRGHVGDGHGVPGRARCGRRRRRRDLASGRMRLRRERTGDPDTKIAACEGPGTRDGVPRTWVVGRLVLEQRERLLSAGCRPS